MEYRDDIEQLVKNSFDNFEADVKPDVWMNIQSSLVSQPVTPDVSAGSKVAAVSSKFSVSGIIGTAAAIIGITASVVYFSSDRTNDAVPANKLETVQNTAPVVAEPVVENNTASQSANANRETTPSSPGSSMISDNDVNENALAAKENSNYYSTTEEDAEITSMGKKDAGEVKPENNSIPEDKQAVSQVLPTITEEKKLKNTDNNEEEGLADQNQDSEANPVTSIPNEEKSINEYLKQIHNVITPNGDGDNDVFIIESKDLLSLRVIIFDQSTGKTIHQWNNLHGFWDGKTENGQQANEGMYIYNIFAQPKTGKPITKTGTLHLILN